MTCWCGCLQWTRRQGLTAQQLPILAVQQSDHCAREVYKQAGPEGCSHDRARWKAHRRDARWRPDSVRGTLKHPAMSLSGRAPATRPSGATVAHTRWTSPPGPRGPSDLARMHPLGPGPGSRRSGAGRSQRGPGSPFGVAAAKQHAPARPICDHCRAVWGLATRLLSPWTGLTSGRAGTVTAGRSSSPPHRRYHLRALPSTTPPVRDG
jgi:hypothetical protein